MSTTRSLKKITEMASDEECDNPKKEILKKPLADNSLQRSGEEESMEQGDSAKDYSFEFIMHVVKPYK